MRDILFAHYMYVVHELKLHILYILNVKFCEYHIKFNKIYKHSLTYINIFVGCSNINIFK